MVYASPDLIERLVSAEAENLARRRRAVTLLTGFIAVLFLALLSVLTSSPAAASPLFVEAEHRLGIAPFSKWQQLVARQRAETVRVSSGLIEPSGADQLDAARQLWRMLIGVAGEETPEGRLYSINAFFNAFRYAPDHATWKTADHWATPLQFITRAQGDCEDLAAAKYFALRASGVPAENLRLAVMLIDGHADAHAVLLVRIAGQIQVLDNRSDSPTPLASLYGSRLVYSVNEDYGWLHLQARPVAVQTTASLQE